VDFNVAAGDAAHLRDHLPRAGRPGAAEGGRDAAGARRRGRRRSRRDSAGKAARGQGDCRGLDGPRKSPSASRWEQTKASATEPRTSKSGSRCSPECDGANVVYDPVGGSYSETALRAIAWEGRFLVVGFAAGDIPKIPLNLVLLKGCQLLGVFWGAFAMREAAKNRANADRILQWVSEGKLKPHVDETFPFARAAAALERLERRTVLGKIVLVP